MACYVDPTFDTKPTPRWPYQKSCHLMCDTHKELIDMGEQLGMLEQWLQHKGTPREHYDLIPKRRKKAIALGALEISWREMALIRGKKATTARRRETRQ